MKSRGFSLLEVVISAAILAVVLGALYSLLLASTRMTETEMSLRNAQFQLQERMNQISSEMRESSPSLVRLYAFSDPQMATTAQTLIAMVSARNGADEFQVSFAQPQWQKLVVYAPVFNSVLNVGELRRYEITPVPPEFTDPAVAPAISVTTETLELGSVSLSRNLGERVCLDFDSLTVTQNGTWFSLNLSLFRNTVVEKKSVDLQSGVKGRN